MKYLVPFLLFLTGCAHTPMLEEGGCYMSTLNLNENTSEVQFLASFKIIKIQEIKGFDNYLVQPLDLWSAPIQPGNRYSHVKVGLFDSSVAPISHRFWFDEENRSVGSVQCSMPSNQPPLRITGRKP